MSESSLEGAFVSIQHINVPSLDLERSRRFYCETLGFVESPRPPFSVNGIWLEVKQGQSIHITEVVHPEPTVTHHFAIQVRNLDRALQRLRLLGVESRMASPVPGAGLQAYIQDPDGNVIELIELLDQAAEPG